MKEPRDNPKPRRRWYQFSLRTLLIFVTLAALPLGWLGSKFAQRRKERAVIAWIEEKGGRAEFDQFEEPTSLSERFDQWFGVNVPYVYLDGTPISDLSPLAGMPNLRRLVVSGTRVSDLSPLAKLRRLRVLGPRFHKRERSIAASGVEET